MTEPTPSELSTAADIAEVEEEQRPPRMPAFLSVLIMREGPGWIAQVLEHDLATQAAKREDIEYEIERLIVGHVTACRSQGLNPFELPPAPSQYRDLYEHATWFKTVADWSGWDVAGLLPTLEIAEWFEQTDCSPVTGRPYECPEAEAMLGAEASVAAPETAEEEWRASLGDKANQPRVEECARCGQVGPVDVACSGCALATNSILRSEVSRLEMELRCALLQVEDRGNSFKALSDDLSSLVIAHVRPCVVGTPLENLTRIGGMLASLAKERDRAVRLHRRALERIRTLSAKGKRRATRSRR